MAVESTSYFVNNYTEFTVTGLQFKEKVINTDNIFKLAIVNCKSSILQKKRGEA